jgi:tyrosyl-tRNA synthetase
LSGSKKDKRGRLSYAGDRAVKSVGEQLELIRRGVDQIVPEADLVRKLERSVATKTPLRVKYGIDPTGIDVHLGHTVPLRKLRTFQELGHQAVLILGNYTALVGDPSGRDETRASLTEEQVESNARDYLAQVSKVIDISKAEVTRNGDWFSRMSFLDVMRLLGRMTVQRMLERDDFTKRLKAETPISLHECLYPLMQGHDSVEIRADVELGGTEQLFNLMVGRRLQEMAGQEPQVCLTLPILIGLDGTRRMGKSLGNYIGVSMPPSEQFGRTMSIPDPLMHCWFTLLTDRSPEEIAALTNPEKTHPMSAKKTLACDIVTFYHGAEAGRNAWAAWENQFSAGEVPSEIPEVEVPASSLSDGQLTIVKLLTALKLATSGNEARRLVQGGGVSIGADQVKVTDPYQAIPVTNGLLVRVGRKWAKVRVV